MPAITSNTEKFQALVKEFNVPLTAIAPLVHRSYQRVKDWHSGKHHTITTEALELLELKLRDMRSKGQL